MADLAFPVLNSFILGSVLVATAIDYVKTKRKE
jgi:hypothetical protein